MAGRLVGLYVRTAAEVPGGDLGAWLAANVKGLPAKLPAGTYDDAWVVLSDDGTYDVPWKDGQPVADAIAAWHPQDVQANPIVAYKALAVKGK